MVQQFVKTITLKLTALSDVYYVRYKTEVNFYGDYYRILSLFIRIMVLYDAVLLLRNRKQNLNHVD